MFYKKSNISQSYWIGTIIKQVNFKMVSFIELPKLEFVGLEQAVWKNFISNTLEGILFTKQMAKE